MSADTTKSKVDTWMPWYVADYLADTSHLCAAEHGAYVLLIMHAWMNDGYLPKDDKRLCRVARMSPEEWAESREVLLEFFYECDAGYRQVRVDAELVKARALREQRAEAGRLSAAKRAHQREGNDRSTGVEHPLNERSTSVPTKPPTDGQRKLNTTPSPTPTSPEANASVGQLIPLVVDHNLPPKNPSLSPEESNTRATWDAYSAAYHARYGVDPVRNASVNGKLAQFVKRIGAQESPLVAGFYLRSNKATYVRDKHAVGWLLKDAETLRTEWVTGRQGTDTEARQADRTAATGNVFRELIEESHGQQNAA